MKTIIFDFYRTLYDPDKKRLMYGVKSLLRFLVKREFTIFILSRNERQRMTTIKQCGILRYCTDALLVDRKDIRHFRTLARRKNISVKKSFVVGDRIRDEIRIGNRLGFTTIWIRQGKFAEETPRNISEKPYATVTQIRDIARYIR